MNESESNPAGSFKIEPIGYIESCFSEKFGVPRQPGLVPAATARLRLVAPFDAEEMVRGLAGFSHLWLYFVFHKSIQRGWKSMVRPPRLGGNKKVGVFASRSPQRPNFLGMSVVGLREVVCEKGRVVLDLDCVDLLDGTPVIDVKPYLPYSDHVAGASGGYALEEPAKLQVEIRKEDEEFCHEYLKKTGRDLFNLLSQVLALDPRPGYQSEDKREYGLTLWDVNARFYITAGCVHVVKLERV